MERKKPPITVDAGANECTHYRTQFRDFSKQLKELPWAPAISYLGIYRKNSIPYHKDICNPMFLVTSFITNEVIQLTYYN